jgi:Legionella pneumophila major outer membrane protein precursor
MKKKLFSYLILSFFTFQNLLLADSENNVEFFSNLENRIACISECNVQDSLQAKIASAGIKSGFVVDASFLYQQGLIDHLTCVKTISQVSGNAQLGETLIIEEQIDNLNFKWKPGVRVNLGYVFFKRDQLSVNFTWTYLNGEGMISTTFNDPTFELGSLKPSWFPFLLGPMADQADAKWDCKLNILDGTFGRNFFLGRWFTFHPYGGVRGVWIDQDYNAKYHAAWRVDTTGSGDQSLSFYDTKFEGKNDFTGAGLLFGLEANWYLSCNFSVFTNLKTSIFYGKFELQQLFDGQIVIPITGIPTIIIPEVITEFRDVHRIRPSLEGEMGIRWEHFFCRNSYRFFTGLSYEFSFWFFQNIFENLIGTLDSVQNSFVTANIDPRNLQFQGINFQLGFDF